MPISAYVFHTSRTAVGLYDTFFGGLFTLKGVAIALQVGWVVVASVGIVCAVVAHQSGNRRAYLLSQALPCVAIVFLGFIFFQPWDELFVNLRHSLHFAELGRFSFNRHQALEATVDFLPYWTIGLLGKLGLPLAELALFLSVGGTLVTLFACRALLVGWNVPSAKIWAIPVFSLLPIIWFNTGHGFSSPLFGGMILWGIFALFFSRRMGVGVLLLSLVPLVRVEGAWCSLLLLAWSFRKNGKLLFHLAGIVPILILSLWRLVTFGSVIPLPIQYKNTPGNLFFMAVGLRNLFTDFIASYSLFAVLGVFGCILCVRKTKTYLKPQLSLLGLLFLFVVPYYSSGGDWFPNAWGRYLYPFAIFALLTLFAAISYTSQQLSEKQLIGGALIFLALLALHLQVPYGPAERIQNYLFTGRRILGDLSFNKKRRMNYRIHYLTQLGNHFRDTTEDTAKIATSEIATISYHARRETLDMLGLANPEVIAMPHRKLPSFVQSPKEETELPHLIFKRVHPGLIPKYMPEYLYMFDFFVPNIIEDIPYEELTPKDLLIAFGRWQRAFRRLIDGVYGGFDKVIGLGYEPFIVMYDNRFAALYFVAPHAVKDHIQRLGTAGFAGGYQKLN